MTEAWSINNFLAHFFGYNPPPPSISWRLLLPPAFWWVFRLQKPFPIMGRSITWDDPHTTSPMSWGSIIFPYTKGDCGSWTTFQLHPGWIHVQDFTYWCFAMQPWNAAEDSSRAGIFPRHSLWMTHDCLLGRRYLLLIGEGLASIRSLLDWRMGISFWLIIGEKILIAY